MYRSITSILTVALSVTAMHAGGKLIIMGDEYRTDTLEHYKAAPSTTVTVMDLTGPVKQRIWLAETDLKDENVHITTYNPDLIRTTNTTLAGMVANRKNDGKIYCLGVNADLFSTNGPIGTTVMDGEILKTAKASTAWHAVGLEENDGRKLYMGTAKLVFSARLNGNQEYAPSLVNVPRADGETVLYTRHWGATTGTPAKTAGLEVALRPADGILHSDGPTECVVTAAPENGVGNMAIPEAGFVLSTNIARHITDLSKMKVGDVYTVNMVSASIQTSDMSSHSFTDLRTMIGGDPMLLVAGQKLSSYATMPNYKTRRPRTAVGTDETRSKVYMLVVDGDSRNNGISAGMTADELVSAIQSLGWYDALNFDGGGSSEIWTQKFGTLNRPSDGHSRPVRNGWFITTPDVEDNDVSEIAFACGPQTLATGETFTPKVYGYNKAGVLVNTDLTGVILEAPEELGSISPDGRTLTVTGNGTYRLTARVGNLVCHLGVRAGDYMGGVGDIVAGDSDNAPAVYYNLNGIRVQNPASGVFLCRKGAKVTKVLIL